MKAKIILPEEAQELIRQTKTTGKVDYHAYNVTAQRLKGLGLTPLQYQIACRQVINALKL